MLFSVKKESGCYFLQEKNGLAQIEVECESGEIEFYNAETLTLDTLADFENIYGVWKVTDELLDKLHETKEIELLFKPCRYCGGNCPNDEDNCCDGYSGDIDGLYQ